MSQLRRKAIKQQITSSQKKQSLYISPQLKQSYNFHRKDQFAPLSNPYKKNFNIRRFTHTQQSTKKTQEKYQIPNANSINLRKINGSLDLKKQTKYNNLRLHTEKVSKSPYKLANRLETIDHQQNTLNKRYHHLTAFQKDQISRYEVFYTGKRRINNIQDFTDIHGESKIQIGDGISYRYQIKSQLGKGSFGQVYKAYDHKKNETVALKIVKSHPKFTAQSKVQIRILQHVVINDPQFKSNIVQLKHGFFFRSHACLVFQLLHINLYEFLKAFNFQGLSLDLIRRFAIQILQALQFFKKYDIIHCDLKPQNILLKQENKTGLKVIDVGSGCFESQQIYTYIQSRFYRAPQIIIGAPYTPAIDMWSFGCIICELFTGFPIFPGQNQQEQMQMFMEILGNPQKQFLETGQRVNKFFQNFQPIIKPNSRGRIRKPASKTLAKVIKSEDHNFINFIQLCFKWNPNQRIGPNQALIHPWILDGIPQQLRKLHLIQIQKHSKHIKL